MKMRIEETAWPLGLLLVTGLIAACGPSKPAVDRSEEEKALRALDIAWSEAANRKDVDAVVTQVAESGELGFTSGIYTLTYNDANGQLVADRGKYLEVWRKVDGKWKCVSDAFNSDLPLP